jgi:F0F1-type ATP synthase membrane subunit b/b'
LDEAAGSGSEISDLYEGLMEELEEKKDNVNQKLEEAGEIIVEIREDAKEQVVEISGSLSGYLAGKLQDLISGEAGSGEA